MSTPDYDELMQPVIGFLGCETPKAWLDEALNNLELLMQDHANCEKGCWNSDESDVPL
jgi:tRNA-(ms[2]io[6]A)-hydroxylase